MSIHVPARATAMCFAALVGLLTVGLPAETLAQASGERVHSVRRLGGTSRFTPAVRNIKAMQTAFARPRTQTDLTTVLKIAGLSHIEAEVKKAIADGAVREVTMAPGTNLQWMALRRGGRRADILRLVRWDGPKPFPAFEFVVDDLKETYTFVIPQDCGNLSLVSREPSREQARRDAEAAAARAEEARKAEEARRAEEARKAEEARRAAEAAAAEAARKAAEAAAAEAARKAAEAAAAEAARQAAEAARLAEERELSLRPFVAGFFGKQRRQSRRERPGRAGYRLPAGILRPAGRVKVGYREEARVEPVGDRAGRRRGRQHRPDRPDQPVRRRRAELQVRQRRLHRHRRRAVGLHAQRLADAQRPGPLRHPAVEGLPTRRRCSSLPKAACSSTGPATSTATTSSGAVCASCSGSCSEHRDSTPAGLSAFAAVASPCDATKQRCFVRPASGSHLARPRRSSKSGGGRSHRRFRCTRGMVPP